MPASKPPGETPESVEISKCIPREPLHSQLLLALPGGPRRSQGRPVHFTLARRRPSRQGFEAGRHSSVCRTSRKSRPRCCQLNRVSRANAATGRGERALAARTWQVTVCRSPAAGFFTTWPQLGPRPRRHRSSAGARAPGGSGGSGGLGGRPRTLALRHPPLQGCPLHPRRAGPARSRGRSCGGRRPRASGAGLRV